MASPLAIPVRASSSIRDLTEGLSDLALPTPYDARQTVEMTEIVMSQTPPILHGPSEKERKYDRQLRLWAASGQAALESANILLLNSGAGTVGVETLKNLVLPGM